MWVLRRDSSSATTSMATKKDNCWEKHSVKTKEMRREMQREMQRETMLVQSKAMAMATKMDYCWVMRMERTMVRM